jgi:type IX secretion system PorP/SprF family membrane protein
MKRFLVVLFLFITLVDYGQDVHLSQFYNSDHLLNPAKIGDYDGDYRLTANYRNQWRQLNKQPISTYLLSFDHVFFLKNHQFSAGLIIASDRFQAEEVSYITGNPFSYTVNTNKILLGLSYGYTWKRNIFRGGVQAGMVMSSSDPSTQTFPSQWDYVAGDFNSKLSNSESQLKPSDNYFDLNIGANWSRKIGKLIPKVGFSVNHINRPNDTYSKVSNKDHLRARKVFYGELNYPLTDKLVLQPKVLWMWTAKANDLLIGSNLLFQTQHKIIPNYYLGAHYRHGIMRIFDALIPTVGFQYKKASIGLSYDVNISSLSSGTASRKGTFEFSMIYTGASTIPKKVLLPCDRY